MYTLLLELCCGENQQVLSPGQCRQSSEDGLEESCAGLDFLWWPWLPAGLGWETAVNLIGFGEHRAHSAGGGGCP